MRIVLVTCLLLLPGAARAQDAGSPDGGAPDAGLLDGGELDGGELDGGEPSDAGASDAGPVDCTPRCEGDTLLFCEGANDLVELDCAAELDGVCGELSAEWGADCLLPEGAACAYGYADGVGRCEGGADGDVCCVNEVAGVDGVCTAQPAGTSCRDLAPATPARPRLSGVADTDDTLESCLGVNCANFPGLSLLPVLLALKLRRRRRS